MAEQSEMKKKKRKTRDNEIIINYYDDDDVYEHEDKKPETNNNNHNQFHRLKEVEEGGDSDTKGQIVSGGAFVGDDNVEDDFKKDKGKENSEPRRRIMSFSDYQQYLFENREHREKELLLRFMKNSGYNQPLKSEEEVRKIREDAFKLGREGHFEPEGSAVSSKLILSKTPNKPSLEQHMLFIGRVEPILPDNPLYKKMPDILIPRSQ